MINAAASGECPGGWPMLEKDRWFETLRENCGDFVLETFEFVVQVFGK
jgi:hypothetical protein